MTLPPAPTTDRANLGLNLKAMLRTFTMVLALLAIWAIFSYVTGGAFLQPRNLSNLLRQMAVTGVLASGMVLVIVAGQIDLSVGSVVGFLGALLAVANTNHGMAPSTSFAIALAAGVGIGLVQGYLTSYQRIPSFIVTLGGMMVFRGLAMWITAASTIPLQENWILGIGTSYLSPRLGWMLTAIVLAVTFTLRLRAHRESIRYGLESSLAGFAAKFALFAVVMAGGMAVLASYEGIPTPVLVMAALMVAIHFAATRMTWGRHVFAIGGNVEAAHVSGINVKLKTLSVFGLMGLLAAIAGMIQTARVGSASPDAGGLLELDAIASCVIGGTSLMGGKGSVLGAILGALVMESLNNGMSMANIEPFWQYIVKGLVLVTAVWADISSQDKR